MTVDEIKTATLNALEQQEDKVIVNTEDLAVLLNRINRLNELCDAQRERLAILERQIKPLDTYI
jgi:ribosomal protein S15P/S13E